MCLSYMMPTVRNGLSPTCTSTLRLVSYLSVAAGYTNLFFPHFLLDTLNLEICSSIGIVSMYIIVLIPFL